MVAVRSLAAGALRSMRDGERKCGAPCGRDDAREARSELLTADILDGWLQRAKC